MIYVFFLGYHRLHFCLLLAYQGLDTGRTRRCVPLSALEERSVHYTMYLHDYEYCIGSRLCFYDSGRCRVTRSGLFSLHAARTKLYSSIYSVTTVSSVCSALAHDRDVDIIINCKTFQIRHLHDYILVRYYDRKMRGMVARLHMRHLGVQSPTCPHNLHSISVA
jgi:hypothetical protein